MSFLQTWREARRYSARTDAELDVLPSFRAGGRAVLVLGLLTFVTGLTFGVFDLIWPLIILITGNYIRRGSRTAVKVGLFVVGVSLLASAVPLAQYWAQPGMQVVFYGSQPAHPPMWQLGILHALAMLELLCLGLLTRAMSWRFGVVEVVTLTGLIGIVVYAVV